MNNNNPLFKEIEEKIELKIKNYKGGRLLPSTLRKRIWNAVDYYSENGSITINEPCDCGSRIRHNNGGNYHDIISIRKDEGKHYLAKDSTSEFELEDEWHEIDNPYNIIIKYGQWL